MTDIQTSAPAPDAEPLDLPGTIGLILAVLAGINLLAGMGIPLIPWLLSGVFALALLLLGAFARPPLRRRVLAMGFVCLIPPLVLLLVEVLPGALGRST